MKHISTILLLTLLLSSCLHKSQSPATPVEEENSAELPGVVEQQVPDTPDAPTPNLDQIQEISTESEPTTTELWELQDTPQETTDEESDVLVEEEQIDEELAEGLVRDVDDIQQELDILFDLIE